MRCSDKGLGSAGIGGAETTRIRSCWYRRAFGCLISGDGLIGGLLCEGLMDFFFRQDTRGCR